MKTNELVIKIRQEQLPAMIDLVKDESFLKSLIEKQIKFFPEQYKDVSKLKIKLEIVD